MEQARYTKYYNPQLRIGLVGYREAWLFENEYPEKLYTEVYRGKLVFRRRGSSLRISYARVRQGLLKRQMLIKEPPLPF